MKSASRITNASAIAAELVELRRVAADIGLIEVSRMIGVAVLAARDAAEIDGEIDVSETAYEEVA